jgi:hypothetical protein
MAKIIDMQAARRRRSVATAAKVAARLRGGDEAKAYAAFMERVRADKPELATLLESVPAAYFGVEGSLF